MNRELVIVVFVVFLAVGNGNKWAVQRHLVKTATITLANQHLLYSDGETVWNRTNEANKISSLARGRANDLKNAVQPVAIFSSSDHDKHYYHVISNVGQGYKKDSPTYITQIIVDNDEEGRLIISNSHTITNSSGLGFTLAQKDNNSTWIILSEKQANSEEVQITSFLITSKSIIRSAKRGPTLKGEKIQNKERYLFNQKTQQVLRISTYSVLLFDFHLLDGSLSLLLNHTSTSPLFSSKLATVFSSNGEYMYFLDVENNLKRLSFLDSSIIVIANHLDGADNLQISSIDGQDVLYINSEYNRYIDTALWSLSSPDELIPHSLQPVSPSFDRFIDDDDNYEVVDDDDDTSRNNDDDDREEEEEEEEEEDEEDEEEQDDDDFDEEGDDFRGDKLAPSQVASGVFSVISAVAVVVLYLTPQGRNILFGRDMHNVHKSFLSQQSFPHSW